MKKKKPGGGRRAKTLYHEVQREEDTLVIGRSLVQSSFSEEGALPKISVRRRMPSAASS